MANISITTICNKSCSFCFASKVAASMDWTTYQESLDFLERSGIPQVRLLGGEPTLHPEFIKFAQSAFDRGFKLVVFTNGHIPGAVIDYISGLPPSDISLQVNMLTDPDKGIQISGGLAVTLRKLRQVVSPGLNIVSPETDPRQLLNIVAQFGTRRRVRVGLAHPTMDGGNRYLSPKNYKAVGEKVALLFRDAREAGVEIDLDCGFVPCMFPDWSEAWIGQELRRLGKRCNPILDILEDGRTVSCLPLSGLQYYNQDKNKCAQDHRRSFQQYLAPLRSVYLFKSCENCLYRKSDFCNGGCLSACMHRLATSTIA